MAQIRRNVAIDGRLARLDERVGRVTQRTAFALLPSDACLAAEADFLHDAGSPARAFGGTSDGNAPAAWAVGDGSSRPSLGGLACGFGSTG